VTGEDIAVDNTWLHHVISDNELARRLALICPQDWSTWQHTLRPSKLCSNDDDDDDSECICPSVCHSSVGLKLENDRSEAGHRPAVGWNLAYHVAH